MRALLIFLILLFPATLSALEIKSSGFSGGKAIPSQYTCDSSDISPGLSWSDAPPGTKSFALICEDPDSSAKPWSHWVIFNIPAEKTGLPEDMPKRAVLGDGATQGINDFGQIGYRGPCPPPGKAHRYFFKLYALDAKIPLDQNAAKERVIQAIKGRVLAQAEIFGTYSRRQ